MSRLFCLILACLLQLSLQKSTPEDDSYVAAAVEYQVSSNVSQNLQNYVQLITQAAEQNVDIIVFPELTLTSGARSVDVPIYGLVKQQPIPALLPLGYDELLVGISTAAREHEIYVLINVQEEMDCTKIPSDSEEYCPEEKVYIFNTNVIFDRTGAIIDRYRKINLFGEFTRTPALRPDLGVFTTDFGVTFGHYICFDLMFQVPAIQVIEKSQITDILFSTMWFSEMPYLTAVQIQEAYAYAQNVNFIGAGANNVRVGSAGSGIYSGKAGALISTMPGLPVTRLLVSRVPKVPGNVTGLSYPGPIYDNPSDHDSLSLITDPSLPDHISRPLVNGFQEFTLVDKEVSCRFQVRLNQREGDGNHMYRAFVQDGSNIYARRETGVVGCLLVACENNDVWTCAYRFGTNETNIEIQELEIEMTTLRKQYNQTLQCDNVAYFPSSLRINKFPLRPANFTYTDSTENGEFLDGESRSNKVNGREKIVYKINAPQNELMAFGIWGRIYEYQYRAAVFDGERSFSGLAEGDTRICSVIACTGDSMETCGKRFPTFAQNTTSIFEELSIVATVPTPVVVAQLNAMDSAFFPVSLDVSIMPLEAEEYTYTAEQNNESTVYTLTLVNTEKELYSFAVWGRVYPQVPGSSIMPVFSKFLLAVVIVLRLV